MRIDAVDSLDVGADEHITLDLRYDLSSILSRLVLTLLYQGVPDLHFQEMNSSLCLNSSSYRSSQMGFSQMDT